MINNSQSDPLAPTTKPSKVNALYAVPFDSLDPLHKRAPLRICMTTTVGASLVTLIGVPVGFLALATPIVGWICLAVAASLAITAIIAGFCHIYQQDELLSAMANVHQDNNKTFNKLNGRIKNIISDIENLKNRIGILDFPAASDEDTKTPWVLLSIKTLIANESTVINRLETAESNLKGILQVAQQVKVEGAQFIMWMNFALANINSRVENLENLLNANSQEPGTFHQDQASLMRPALRPAGPANLTDHFFWSAR